METTLDSALTTVPEDQAGSPWQELWRTRHADQIALGLALVSVPLSIAVAELFLGIALVARTARLLRGKSKLSLPRVFWYWLPFAGWIVVRWAASAEHAAGWSEIRHVLLVGSLFLLLPAMDSMQDRLMVWKGIFLSATLCSLFLIGDFLSRLVHYQKELAVGGDPGLYLRSGGLLNHWMVYGTVEILVFAGLLSFWQSFPEERRRWYPVFLINAAAMLVSLTRMVWLTSLLLLVLDLAWRRSRWLLAAVVLPAALYLVAPSAVRSRVLLSMRPDYYSNAERLEMLRVGWRMVRAHPLAGVGPGQVGKLYRAYLSAGSPIPAYYDHLHDNAAELAAEFGVPILLWALLFVGSLSLGLVRASRQAMDRENAFLCSTGILGLAGFLIAGLVEYTYGHSLGLILLCFVVLSPLHASSPSVLAQTGRGQGLASDFRP